MSIAPRPGAANTSVDPLGPDTGTSVDGDDDGAAPVRIRTAFANDGLRSLSMGWRVRRVRDVLDEERDEREQQRHERVHGAVRDLAAV
jgi:flagellar motor component MotA